MSKRDTAGRVYAARHTPYRDRLEKESHVSDANGAHVSKSMIRARYRYGMSSVCELYARQRQRPQKRASKRRERAST